MNIYVGNLPNTMTDHDLQEIFSEYGEVHSAKIINDRETGRSRGFAFVDMSENAGRKAISELNGAEYDGRQLTVNEARPKTSGGSSYGNRGGGGYNNRRSW